MRPFYPRPSCRPPRTRCNIWPATQPSALASDEAKACTLADDSAFLPLLWNIEDDFEKKTAVIAGDWFRVMQENPAIPAGDAAFLLLEIDGAEYLAALKLNYKPGWLHYCRMDGGPASMR